jgi:hypothetical protein
MRSSLFGVLLCLLVASLTPAARAADPGITVALKLESGEVNAGETLQAAAIVTNEGGVDQLVLLEGFLAPVEEPIGTPPIRRFERFVYEVLARLSGDFALLRVPAGESRVAVLDVEVHPRMHGRFDVVAAARTARGVALDRKSVISKITAPPSNGAVLVHGMVYELGDCRLLLTDDGHIYEPKGAKADELYRLLDSLYPRPDGITVLGAILPNTLGCFGVELEVDLFRFDRTPGEPVGVKWRHLARGRTSTVYTGPGEEIVRTKERFKEVVDELGATVTGRVPDFRREMVAAVVIPGSSLTTVRIGRIVEKDGTLTVHYRVVNPATVTDAAEKFAEVYHLVALPKFAGPIEFVRKDLSIRVDAPRTGVLEVEESLDLAGLATMEVSRTLAKQERVRRKALSLGR